MNGIYWALLIICSEVENRWNYKAVFCPVFSETFNFFFFCVLSEYIVWNILNNNCTPVSINGKLKLTITFPETSTAANRSVLTRREERPALTFPRKHVSASL